MVSWGQVEIHEDCQLCGFELMMLTMPDDGLWIGQEMRVDGAKQFTSCHLLEQEILSARFLEAVLGHDHAQIVCDGPEATVEKPMCSL